LTPIIPTSRPLSIGFYVNWDDSSYESLKRNLDHLDWIIPAWVTIQDITPTNPNPIVSDLQNGVEALNLIRDTRPQVTILPMVQNVSNEKFDGDLLGRMVSDESHRQQLIKALLNFVQSNKFGGVCIDFEEPPATAQSNLLTFMQELPPLLAQTSC
jgi:spore germination protein YaaH